MCVGLGMGAEVGLACVGVGWGSRDICKCILTK